MTNDDRMPLVSFNVSARVVGDLHFVPERVVIGGVPPSEAFERVFRIASRRGSPFTVLSVEAKRSNFQEPLEFEVVEVDGSGGTQHDIRIKGQAPRARVPLTGTLLVLTDSPGEEQMEIAFHGYVRPTPVQAPDGPGPQPLPQPEGPGGGG